MKQWLLLVLAFSLPAYAVEIVTENPHPACEELHLSKSLKLYKDPTLFVSQAARADEEPGALNDSPLLTTLTGTIQLMRLGPPQEFRHFGALAKVYELEEPRLRSKREKGGGGLESSPLIVPIKVCGDAQPYTDTLGFVLLSDLRESQAEQYEPGMLPPSTVGNPIPTLPKTKRLF